MPYQRGIKLITKAVEQASEDRLWQQWLTVYPHMSMGKLKFVSFKDFIQEGKPIPKTDKTTEELIAEAEEIRAMDLGTREGA